MKRVAVAEVQRELARLCRAPAQTGESPATGASMANLIVWCRSDQQADEVAREIPAIVARHPARVVVLVADSVSQTAELDAAVATHGRVVEGTQQICGEHATIRTGGPGVRRLPSVVRSLLLGDLPTTLWWASPEAPPLIGEVFNELADLAEQVVYDSVAWADPLRQLIVVAKWLGIERPQVGSDLAWRRPKLWRRLIAQSLDPATSPGALQSIIEVQIEHGPHALTQAWLLSGWLAFRLGWTPRGGKVAPGPEVQWWFEWPHGRPQVRIRRLPEGEAEITRVSIVARASGRPTTFRFSAEGPGRITMLTEPGPGRRFTLSGPVPSRAELVSRQLLDLARDRLFQDSLGLARTMAEAIL